MGQRPTHRNETQDVTPAKAGVQVWEELDSRLRGNDDIQAPVRGIVIPATHSRERLVLSLAEGGNPLQVSEP
jgi:hypothetical protein